MSAMENLYNRTFGRYPLTPMTEEEMADEIAERIEMMESARAGHYDIDWVSSLTDAQLRDWVYLFDPEYLEDGGGMLVVLKDELRWREANNRRKRVVRKGHILLPSEDPEGTQVKALIIGQLAIVGEPQCYSLIHIATGKNIVYNELSYGLNALALCRILKHESVLAFDFNTYFASWRSVDPQNNKAWFLREALPSMLNHAKQQAKNGAVRHE